MTTHEWTARSGVRVTSSVPRAECSWLHAVRASWTYAFTKYLLGRGVHGA